MIKDSLVYLNPRIIPRNHIIEKYIKEAENNNYKNIYNYLIILRNPYKNEEIPNFLKSPPTDNEKVLETYCGT